MPEGPTILEAKIPGSNVYSVTLTISSKPTPADVIKAMAEVAKFLTKLSIKIMDDEKGPAMVSAANPAPNAMLQSAATLEHGALQFDGIVRQNQGLAVPQQAPQRGPFRTN